MLRSASNTQVRFVLDDLDRTREVWLLENLEPAHVCGAADPAEQLVVRDDFAGMYRIRRAFGNGLVLEIGRDDDLHRAEDIVSRTVAPGVLEEIYRRQYVRNEVHDRIHLGKTELHDPPVDELHVPP